MTTPIPPEIKTELAEWYEPILPKESFTLLDLGCGSQRRTRYFNFSDCVGVDGNAKYKDDCHPATRFVNADVVTFLQNDEQTFDVVACFEVIEHQRFDVALRLIGLMKTRAKRLLVLVSPDGYSYNFQENHGDDNLEEHRCGFTQDQFEFLDFTVKRLVDMRMGLKVRHDEQRIPYPPSWDRLMAYWRP